MATAELAIDAIALRRRRKPLRYFFLGMAALAVIILALAFVPEFVWFARGTFPIAWVLHIHAAIMGAWVASFVTQAYLGATGLTAQHRRIGPYAVAVGWLACASMVFVEFRTFVAYPIPTDVADYDWKLPGPQIYLTFAIFLAWATHERRRPAWHKRLMTFALFLSLDAAIQRYVWIPMDDGFGPFMAVLDVVLLVPLAGYDLATLKGRLHPATVRGGFLLFVSQGLLLALWGTALWHQFASWAWHSMHAFA